MWLHKMISSIWNQINLNKVKYLPLDKKAKIYMDNHSLRHKVNLNAGLI